MDTEKYVVTDDTELVEEEADLDREAHTWPDGTPMTEANTEAYSASRAGIGGRPSLGDAGSSPQVAFRTSRELRREAERLAVKEGRTVSALARAALEEYVVAHR